MFSYRHMQKVMPYVLLCVMLYVLMHAHLYQAKGNSACAHADIFGPCSK